MTTPRGPDRPPGLWTALLKRVLPDSERDVVEGELSEGFRARSLDTGPEAARRWYRRQVMGFVVRSVTLRGLARRGEGTGMRWLDETKADLRWAIRSLRRRPTFTAVAVATLALGIGANSAIFTLVSAHYFEPLPYERPDELVLLWETGRDDFEVNTVAPGNYLTWREDSQTLADIAAYNVDNATLSGDGPAERVAASVVVPHFFQVLGVAPVLGPGFSEASVRASDGRQVVLSHSLWTRRFGADPAIVGRDVRINGLPHAVVGVLPRAYRQPERNLTWQTTELWRPMLLDGQQENRGGRYLRTIARRRPGVSVDQARDEMTRMGERLAARYPEANGGRAVLVRTLDEYLMGDARPTLRMLLLAGAAVLLIVCANVANLTLARGEERRREFALRSALGSGGGRLLRQVIVEGVVLALVGAAVGTAFVLAGSGVLQAIQTRFFSSLVEVGVDWRVVGFTVSLAVSSGVLFGLPLARTASRPDVAGTLSEAGARSGSGRGAAVTRNILIVGQVGIATTLLVVAVLLGRSFNSLVNVAPGFEPEGVIAFQASAPQATYPEVDDYLRYHRDLLVELESMPGVAQVGMVSDLMFTTENMNAELFLQGPEAAAEESTRAELHVMLPEYFDVLGIPLLRGTLPDGWEASDGEVPAVVNERLSALRWPDGDAIGSTFTMSWSPGVVHRVVAEVGSVLDDGYAAVADPAFYVPLGSMPRRRMAYLVRTDGEASGMTGSVREAVGRVDPDIPAGDLQLLSGMMAETAGRPRAASLIGLAFAVIALLVASAGIYGVLSYVVQSRTREIGIRAALGATGDELVGMVMGQSTRLIGLGLIVGAAASLVAGRYLASLLFGVQAWDPLSLLTASTVLAVAGLLASWIPARRAVRIDPTEALRSE